MARPTKKSPERVQALLAALRLGSTRTNAVESAELSLDTFARWMADDAEFRGQVTKAEADAELRYVGQVAKHATRSPQAAQWWLEHRRRAEWGQKTAIELSGPDGGPIDHREVSALDDYEKLALSEAIRDHLALGRGSDVPAGSTSDPESGD